MVQASYQWHSPFCFEPNTSRVILDLDRSNIKYTSESGPSALPALAVQLS